MTSSATVSLAQLLSGSFDVDGDQLSVKNVKALEKRLLNI